MKRLGRLFSDWRWELLTHMMSSFARFSETVRVRFGGEFRTLTNVAGRRFLAQNGLWLSAQVNGEDTAIGYSTLNA